MTTALVTGLKHISSTLRGISNLFDSRQEETNLETCLNSSDNVQPINANDTNLNEKGISIDYIIEPTLN